ncbi:MAG: hypothetical protein HOJ15_00135 [Candidatus Jacksonbacteria bacterium]|jgi:exonuclease III|nr:hypothetical protein [Candidatus Jacksonbacteria bacterium]MBT6034194.1 hypothetical protein [Candidatus Jacksonbacteria bacterium]MBT6300824.1 hypothetical protein [Candidatus Jacksonbacteria bacterium]MBT6757095.1 hypothetical protein [Candidatus Jacksonbacteria bacterium]MBT6955650.1 hypothetical protein [Candidatus Jacksonbacteria bacterium]
MTVKTLQWNIGGAKTRNESAAPAEASSYSIDNLDYIIAIIKESAADIVTLQETHAQKENIQAEEIAKQLGYFYINDVYAESHLEKDSKLGQSIISKFPLENHSFELFKNPQLELTRPDGEIWESHDKGISSCEAKISDSVTLGIQTAHMVPFRKFDVDPLSDELQEIREDIQSKINIKLRNSLFQGDFNINDRSLKEFLPNIFKAGYKEVLLDEPTTPKGRFYDHVVYKNIQHLSSKVLSSAFTDHFPVYSEFKVVE